MQLPITILASIASTVAAANLFASKPYSQDTLDNYNVLRFVYNSGPYSSSTGYGIERDAPYSCNVTQAHSIARHGERFPTAGTGKSLTSGLARIRNFTDEVTGPLAFLTTYDFPAINAERYDSESNRGPYSGLANMYNFGADFRNRYNDIYEADFDNENVTIKFFAASQQRVVDSAYKFAEGFLGVDVTESDGYVVSLNETSDVEGANSLTPGASCLNFNQSANDAYIAEYSTGTYINSARARFNELSPELNLTKAEVSALIDYCGYDLNVAGRSAVCELFTTTELLARSYYADLQLFYEHGPGHNLSLSIGSTYVSAIIELLSGDNITLTNSFSHDTDITKIYATLGLFDGEGDLPVEYVDFNAPWKSTNIVPMGGRLIFEKLECENYDDSFVRLVANDVVIPIPGLSEGPGFSTSLSNFTDYINDRIEGRTYADACTLEDSDVPTELTFFWDSYN